MRTPIFILACLLLVIPCQAEIITVNADGTGDYPTIQAAIDAANDGDIIELQLGTYTGDGNREIDFHGKAITVRSKTGPENCVVDCQGIGRAFYFHSGEDENARLEGITIVNGYAYDGAGICCENASPSIRNCSFIGGVAEEWGGGIYCYKSSPLISNCTFTGNSAFEGGAITTYSDWNYLCSPRIENCHIFGNTASGSGGGVNSDCLSTPIISNCLITGNSAGSYGGGGISIFQSNPTITGCTIVANSAESAGCGILQWYEFENGSTIKNCIIWGNTFGFEPQPPFGGPTGPQITLSSEMSISYCDIEYMWIDTLPGANLNLGEGVFEWDPFFVDPFGGNYHLLEFSPCIDRGDPGYFPEIDERDIDGQPRRMGYAVDIGAYEFPGPIYEPMPILQISTTEFEFDANEDRENPEAQTLLISNIGIGTLNWQILEDCPWLEIDPVNGESTGEADEVTLDVDISGLVQGQYHYTFIVEASGAHGSPQMVDVDLTVHGPRIDLSATQLEFFLSEGSVNPESHTLTVTNGAGGTLNWNVSYDCNWIGVEPVDGISVEQPNEITIWPADLGNYTIPSHHICEMIVSADDASNSPQTVEVILHVEGELRVPEHYPTIQAAIDASMDRDVVIVSEGIYTGTGNRDLDFEGRAITVRSTNPDDPCVVAATVIDCEGTQAEPHRGFRFHSGEKRDSVVAGLTITNGYAPDENHGGGMLSVGGAIWCRSAGPTIAKCRVLNNIAGIGGGIYSWAGKLVILQCEISQNSADFFGGGIHIRVGRPEIIDCVIENNLGGGIYLMGCWDPLVSGCSILRNINTQKGGGIYTSANHDSIIIKNCIISDNSASSGGGILCEKDYVGLTVTNCSISNNEVTYYGGGIYNYRWGPRPKLSNCILWGNTAPNGPQLAGSVLVSFSNVQGIGPGNGNINADPLFHDPNSFDYHLVFGSPCIDTGDNRVVPADTTDLDGNPRIMDGNNDGNSVVDMGAYEFFNTPPIADAGPNQVAYAWIDGIAEVVLDGNDSNDPDGDELTYYWSWMIGDLMYDANGVSPTIELPVGEHTIQLVVNDGLLDSEPDYVNVNVVGLHDRVVELINEAIAEKAEALQKINAALEKELVAYETLEQILESGDYGDWSREDILGARWNISIAILYDEDYIKKVLEKNIDKLQRTLSVLGVEPDEGNNGDIPVPSVGVYEAAVLSLHELVINLIEEALAEKAEALEIIDAALQKERKAYQLLEQMLESGDYGDWNRQAILRAKSRIYVAIKYEEYLKKVLMIMTVEKLEDSLSVLGIEPDVGSG